MVGACINFPWWHIYHIIWGDGGMDASAGRMNDSGSL